MRTRRLKLIAVTQRVAVCSETGERRDSLDQRWAVFLERCGLSPLAVPNRPKTARALVEGLGAGGVLLTGGNNLAACGGDAPERDETETALLRWALARRLPILGVCRGMQVIQAHYGVKLEPVEGHVAKKQTISILGKPAEVNSYHNWGARGTKPSLEVWAEAADGVVKAVRGVSGRVAGIMWHPERISPASSSDIRYVRGFYAGPGR